MRLFNKQKPPERHQSLTPIRANRSLSTAGPMVVERQDITLPQLNEDIKLDKFKKKSTRRATAACIDPGVSLRMQAIQAAAEKTTQAISMNPALGSSSPSKVGTRAPRQRPRSASLDLGGSKYRRNSDAQDTITVSSLSYILSDLSSNNVCSA